MRSALACHQSEHKGGKAARADDAAHDLSGRPRGLGGHNRSGNNGSNAKHKAEDLTETAFLPLAGSVFPLNGHDLAFQGSPMLALAFRHTKDAVGRAWDDDLVLLKHLGRGQRAGKLLAHHRDPAACVPVCGGRGSLRFGRWLAFAILLAPRHRPVPPPKPWRIA
jgi:hypothetical protein